MLLDHDTKGMPPDVATRIAACGGFWPTLLSIVPELKDVARVRRASTSAGLFRADDATPLPSSSNAHVYALVQDGQDVARFLKALHDRCWLAGFGWMMVGISGQLLDRSIVDRMVGGPERLVFEGPPILRAPLRQDAEIRRPEAIEGVALDTLAVGPPLLIHEMSRLDDLRARERLRLRPDRAKTRDKLIVRRMTEAGVSKNAAERYVDSRLEGKLSPDTVLPFDDDEFAGCTVGDVLADPARFEGATLADPLEGVDYGRCKAKIFRRADGTPWIHSFAHGRTVYESAIRRGGRARRHRGRRRRRRHRHALRARAECRSRPP